MVLVLVIGDLHVPERAIDVPVAFKKLLVPGKMSQILCTGNLTSGEMHSYLRSLCSDVVCVRGDMDCMDLPETSVVKHGSFRIGIVHGHQLVPWEDASCLEAMARRMDVDVLVSGHSHVFHAFERSGRFFLNPGSVTGGFSPVTNSMEVPSFLLLDVQETSIAVYVYSLREGKVQVQRVSFEKKL